MDESSAGRVLVVGMGVSGIATAARLRAAGWTPVIVERAPGRRPGGYFVALFGAGQAAAKRLGMLEHLHDRSPSVPSVDIDRAGRRRPGMSLADAPGKPWMMLRGDAEQAAFATLPADVEIRYSTVPTAIIQDDAGVEVTLLNTASGVSVTERFDLVVGADGLRSTVRRLVFGPHEDYLQRMNYMIAAFEYPGTPSGLAPGEIASLLEPDRSMNVFAFADHNPTVLLTWRTDDVDAEFTGSHADRVREVFGPEPFGATLGAAIAALDSADGALFDSVEQAHMDSWHRGRVVLVGDSAWCVTLYAGMGVSSGLTGAELLGTVLERHPGDIDTALGEWEQTMRPYIDHYQHSAFDQRKIFVMDTQNQIRARRAMTWLRQYKLGRRILDKVMPLGPTGGAQDPKSADIVGTALAALPPVTQHATVQNGLAQNRTTDGVDAAA